ncbi:glycosyltransferase family 2 protein [Roseovarius bejariae]|nr:glycosyltransferase family 2 protein [Roseovarius bejariae]
MDDVMTRQEKDVTILLGVRNGETHLTEQLNSIARQTNADWTLIVSDDQSSDGSQNILQRFATDHPVTVLNGPGEGFVRNFMHLIKALPGDPSYVAFCDQDDVWLPDKLASGMDALRQIPSGVPALYCSRRIVWNPKIDSRRLSLAYDRPPSFANACIENIAPANTILLNRTAAQLARETAESGEKVFAHDWWLYLLITGVGGKVVYDPEPHVLYRQHTGNQIGAGEQIGRRLKNKLAVLRGSYAERMNRNIAALEDIADHLTPENRQCLALLSEARKAPLMRRLTLLRQAGVYRQGRASMLSFWGAACLGKI